MIVKTFKGITAASIYCYLAKKNEILQKKTYGELVMQLEQFCIHELGKKCL